MPEGPLPLSEHVFAANDWLADPENDDVAIWLRDLVIAARNWVVDAREITRR